MSNNYPQNPSILLKFTTLNHFINYLLDIFILSNVSITLKYVVGLRILRMPTLNSTRPH